MTRRAVAILLLLNLIAMIAVLQRTVWLKRQPAGDDPRFTVESTAEARVAYARAGDVFSLDQSQNPLTVAATKASPAVVAVGGTVSRLTLYVDPFFEGFFWPYFAQPGRKERIEVPFVGSGVLIDDTGHFVTNVHVLEEVETPFVTLSDGRKVKAKLLDMDDRVDIALLKADLNQTPYLVMGDSDKLMPGEWVLAIGNPFGEAIPDPRPTVTAGVVSALHRNYRAGEVDRERIYLDMIQTDAAINPGNSGGPLVNIRGEIVGINTFIVSKTGGSVGIGFAIPVNRVRAVIQEIRQHGHVRNYRMDFEVVDLVPQIARRLGVPAGTRGAIVTGVRTRFGPAAKAGFEVGDIIVEADGSPISSASDLVTYFLSLQVGKEIKFTALREGRRVNLTYAIEEYRSRQRTP